jgi:hypothetical protein
MDPPGASPGPSAGSSDSSASASSSGSSIDEASLRQATTEAEEIQKKDAEIVAAAAISARKRKIHGSAAAQPVFLAPGWVGECVAMASYPRSGNSMLRALLEGATGVVTGSDSRPDRNMARDLALLDAGGAVILHCHLVSCIAIPYIKRSGSRRMTVPSSSRRSTVWSGRATPATTPAEARSGW